MKAKNQKLVESLNKLLADYQMYYQNLRGLHWNVNGAMFCLFIRDGPQWATSFNTHSLCLTGQNRCRNLLLKYAPIPHCNTAL